MKNRKNTRPAEPEARTSGGGQGSDLQHWLQAEKQFAAHASASIADAP